MKKMHWTCIALMIGVEKNFNREIVGARKKWNHDLLEELRTLKMISSCRARWVKWVFQFFQLFFRNFQWLVHSCWISERLAHICSPSSVFIGTVEKKSTDLFKIRTRIRIKYSKSKKNSITTILGKFFVLIFCVNKKKLEFAYDWYTLASIDIDQDVGIVNFIDHRSWLSPNFDGTLTRTYAFHQ